MANTIKLEELTSEQKNELIKQLHDEQQQARKKMQENKETLKSLQDEFVVRFWSKLTDVAQQLSAAKVELFENAQAIIALKKEVYNMSDDALEKQQSHSISTANCDKTIIIGHNTIDGWDPDLSAAGIAGVNKWIESKLSASDNETKELVEAIRIFLKPNKEGVLKANRIVEMASWANKNGDSILIDAVSKLQDAYQPRKTSTFVKAKYRNEDGQDMWLNLSMSNA